MNKFNKLKFWDNPDIVSNFQRSWEHVKTRRKKFVEELSNILKRNMKVLEVGCGTGVITN